MSLIWCLVILTNAVLSSATGCTHGQYYPVSECSGSFYQCSHGTKYLMPCPGSLKWDGTICNYEAQVPGCQGKDEITCEFSTMTLSCQYEGKINIVSANYGRTDVDQCTNYGPQNTNCKATNSQQLVSTACNGKSSCQVSATNGVFGDPCVSVGKYLKVKYVCR